mgnify:CR=1 FL=1
MHMKYKYHYQALLIVSALAVFIVYYLSLKGNFKESLASPKFYYSLSYSYIIAFVTGVLVLQVNLLLNRFFPWWYNGYVRSFLQLLFGLLVPDFLQLLMVKFFLSWFSNADELFKFYLYYSLDSIVMLLVVLNAMYIKLSFLDEAEDHERQVVSAELDGEPYFLVGTGLVCVYRTGDKINAVVKSGEQFELRNDFSKLKKYLRYIDIRQVKEGVLFNLRVTDGIVKMQDGSYRLVPRNIISEDAWKLASGFLHIDRKHVRDIKRYFKDR